MAILKKDEAATKETGDRTLWDNGKDGGEEEGENPCPKRGSAGNQRRFWEEGVQVVHEGQVRWREGVSGGGNSIGKCGDRGQQGRDLMKREPRIH